MMVLVVEVEVVMSRIIGRKKMTPMLWIGTKAVVQVYNRAQNHCEEKLEKNKDKNKFNVETENNRHK